MNEIEVRIKRATLELIMEKVNLKIRDLFKQVSVAIQAMHDIHTDAVILNQLLRANIAERGQYPTLPVFELVRQLDEFLTRFGGAAVFGEIEELRPISPFA